MQAHDALARTLAGMAAPGAQPRADQVAAVDALLAGRRVLLVQATGWGKSAVYWAATLGLREAGRGPTVVISPPQQTYFQDQQVSITATPDAGYSFVDWSGSLTSTNNPLVTTMNSDLYLLASATQEKPAFLTIQRAGTKGSFDKMP